MNSTYAKMPKSLCLLTSVCHMDCLTALREWYKTSFILMVKCHQMVVLLNFPGYTGPPFLSDHPKLIPLVPVERKIECFCGFCRHTQIYLKLGWASTIHRCQGMTIGANEINRYIVIHQGSKMFESRTPGALFVALSQAKSAGEKSSGPDFAWHPSLLINEARICHVVNTPTTKDRGAEVKRIADLDTSTRQKYASLSSDKELQTVHR